MRTRKRTSKIHIYQIMLSVSCEVIRFDETGLNPYQIAMVIFPRTIMVFDTKYDDVIKWKHFPCYWPFVRGIHLLQVNSHTKASDAELWSFLWYAPE